MSSGVGTAENYSNVWGDQYLSNHGIYLSTCHGVVENEVGTLKQGQVIENHDLQMKNMKVL